MTTEEYIQNLKDRLDGCNLSKSSRESVDMALNALEQSLNKDFVSRSAYEQCRWERDTAIAQLADLGYGLGEKPRECGDAISRDDALMALTGEIDGAIEEYIAKVAGRLKALPPARPKQPVCKEVNPGDTLSRSKVLMYIADMQAGVSGQYFDPAEQAMHGYASMVLEWLFDGVKNMSSEKENTDTPSPSGPVTPDATTEDTAESKRKPRKIRKKILPQYMRPVMQGKKTFELRKDEDDVQAGDILVLKEWDGEKYTGVETRKRVTYVLRDVEKYGLMPGYCIIGFSC